MKNLDEVLKSLKTNKTADPNQMINDIFKEGCIGDDLKVTLLEIFNGAKFNHIVPDFVTLVNITTIFKNKWSRLDMKNERGILILTVLKKQLDNLTYFDNYEEIDKNMSDHLLILHVVINSVIRGSVKA